MSSAAASAETGTRRAMLTPGGAGLAAGLALGLAGCSSSTASSSKPKVPPSIRHRDVEILNQLLEIEQQAIAGYTDATPLLSGHLQKAAQQFLGDELAHASELIALIKLEHGKPVKPRATYELGSPSSQADVLQLFHVLERRQITAYLQAIPAVSSGDTRAALGAVLGSDAQHVALIRSALGQPPLLTPFVTGTE